MLKKWSLKLVFVYMYYFFHKNEDDIFALIFSYDTYLRMPILRLAEIIAVRKWSLKFVTLKCTSCHCVVPRASRVIVKKWQQKRQAMAFFELLLWNITTAWFLLLLYGQGIMTCRCRIIWLCVFSLVIQSLFIEGLKLLDFLVHNMSTNETWFLSGKM